MTKKNPPPIAATDAENAPDGIARRLFLMRTTGLLVGASVASGVLRNAKAAEKAAQADVSYQDTPNNGVNCAGCQFFDGGSSCEVVEGDISAEGWCALWSPT